MKKWKELKVLTRSQIKSKDKLFKKKKQKMKTFYVL